VFGKGGNALKEPSFESSTGGCSLYAAKLASQQSYDFRKPEPKKPPFHDAQDTLIELSQASLLGKLSAQIEKSGLPDERVLLHALSQIH
jgi:hypothetical protein